MTARGTFVLVTVLAALMGYLWLFEVRPRLVVATPAPETPPLLAVPPTVVARIELEEHGRRLTAVRDDGGWRDPNGRAWPNDTVSDLVATLGALRPVMVVDEHPEEPTDYGLGAPARRLEVVAADGRRVLALELGERNPAWTGVYARRAGQPEVMLIGAVLSWEIDKLRGAAPAQ